MPQIEDSDCSSFSAFSNGFKDCLIAPGWGIFATMVGFGSLAASTGESLGRSLLIMAGLWSMPGQLTFLELSNDGVTGWALVVAVTVANLRMIPLTMATIPLLRESTGISLRQFWLALVNSVTSFMQLNDVMGRISTRRELDRYFQGFCVGTLILGALGTSIGHSLASELPTAALKTLVFLTPLYLLLLAARTQESMMLTAAVLGCVFVPAMHLWSSDWGVIVGGVVAGSLAFAVFEMRGKNP